jgi:hypothetical protein
MRVLPDEMAIGGQGWSFDLRGLWLISRLARIKLKTSNAE